MNRLSHSLRTTRTHPFLDESFSQTCYWSFLWIEITAHFVRRCVILIHLTATPVGLTPTGTVATTVLVAVSTTDTLLLMILGT